MNFLMDHKYIDDLDIVDRYLMGRLGAEETSEFEEHFVDCEHCVDRLKFTKALIEELRLVGIGQTQEAEERNRGGFWVKHRKALALVAGFISLIALVGVFFALNQVRRARAEADQARIASAQLERRYEEERKSSAIAESGNQQRERELTEQLSQLKKQSEDASNLAASASDEINVPILAPISTRASATLPSSNILALPAFPIRFLISLALEEETAYRDYRMTIRKSDHQLMFNRSGFKRNNLNSVSALLNSTRFKPGDYLLTLEGITAHDGSKVIGQYSFRLR